MQGIQIKKKKKQHPPPPYKKTPTKNSREVFAQLQNLYFP